MCVCFVLFSNIWGGGRDWLILFPFSSLLLSFTIVTRECYRVFPVGWKYHLWLMESSTLMNILWEFVSNVFSISRLWGFINTFYIKYINCMLKPFISLPIFCLFDLSISWKKTFTMSHCECEFADFSLYSEPFISMSFLDINQPHIENI